MGFGLLKLSSSTLAEDYLDAAEDLLRSLTAMWSVIDCSRQGFGFIPKKIRLVMRVRTVFGGDIPLSYRYSCLRK
jgi:hypothetical protein